MGNVNMEATQINDRTGASKMSVAQHLKALDAIAAKIEGLPTFTSNDRAFLEELPAFPSEDGKKALVATTTSGETSLNYEELSDLPADPETDGVRVLTATTNDGETILSYEEPQSGGVVYSSSESEAGTWNGKTLYRRLFNVGVSSGVEWNSTLDNDTPVDFAVLEFGYIDNANAERRFYNCNSYIDGNNHSYAYAGVQNERIHLYHRVDGGLFTNKQLTVSILYTKKEI